MDRICFHILGGDSRSRAEQASVAFAIGQHAEVYANLEELLARPSCVGVVLAAETGTDGATHRIIENLGQHGMWPPVVITSPVIQLSHVIAAIREGALDYLELPLKADTFAIWLAVIADRCRNYCEQRRVSVIATQRIASLSRREHQVLESMSLGLSNKLTAERLRISPRTVEIHRANMMAKLGAVHSAEALKAWLEAAAATSRLAA